MSKRSRKGRVYNDKKGLRNIKKDVHTIDDIHKISMINIRCIDLDEYNNIIKSIPDYDENILDKDTIKVVAHHRRMIKNRLSAKRSRELKKKTIINMENEIIRLKKILFENCPEICPIHFTFSCVDKRMCQEIKLKFGHNEIKTNHEDVSQKITKKREAENREIIVQSTKCINDLKLKVGVMQKTIDMMQLNINYMDIETKAVKEYTSQMQNRLWYLVSEHDSLWSTIRNMEAIIESQSMIINNNYLITDQCVKKADVDIFE